MPGLSDFLFGTQSKMKNFNKQSVGSLEQLLQGGGLENSPLFGAGTNFLQNLLSNSPDAFSAFEAPYLQRFEQQIIPGIAERFAGMGTGAGAGSSSSLNQALGQAGRNLQTDLAGLRSGLQMQALPQAFQYAQGPLQNILAAAGLIPGQYYERPGQGGFVQGISNAFAQGAGQGLTGGGLSGLGSLGNLFGGSSGGFPLTGSYDSQFRLMGLP